MSRDREQVDALAAAFDAELARIRRESKQLKSGRERAAASLDFASLYSLRENTTHLHNALHTLCQKALDDVARARLTASELVYVRAKAFLLKATALVAMFESAEIVEEQRLRSKEECFDAFRHASRESQALSPASELALQIALRFAVALRDLQGDVSGALEVSEKALMSADMLKGTASAEEESATASLMPELRALVDELKGAAAARHSGRSTVRASTSDEDDEFWKALSLARDACIDHSMSRRKLHSLGLRFKAAVDKRRSQLRALLSNANLSQSTQTTLTSIQRRKRQLGAEIDYLCTQMQTFLGDVVLPFFKEEILGTVFALNLLGDSHRYQAEINRTQLEAENAARVYQAALQQAARRGLSPAHPTRLGVALNLCVLYDEILKNAERALEIAQNAVAEARSDTEGMRKFQRDAERVIELLQHNIAELQARRSNERRSLLPAEVSVVDTINLSSEAMQPLSARAHPSIELPSLQNTFLPYTISAFSPTSPSSRRGRRVRRARVQMGAASVADSLGRNGATGNAAEDLQRSHASSGSEGVGGDGATSTSTESADNAGNVLVAEPPSDEPGINDKARRHIRLLNRLFAGRRKDDASYREVLKMAWFHKPPFPTKLIQDVALLSKKCVDLRRSLLKLISRAEQAIFEALAVGEESDVSALLQEAEENVNYELRVLCTEMVSLLDGHILPNLERDNCAALFVTCCSLTGDYQRYLYQLAEDWRRSAFKHHALQSYTTGMECAVSALLACEPARLRLALNMGYFYAVIEGDLKRAIQVTRESLALSEQESAEARQSCGMDAVEFVESLLRRNVIAWNRELRAEGTGTETSFAQQGSLAALLSTRVQQVASSTGPTSAMVPGAPAPQSLLVQAPPPRAGEAALLRPSDFRSPAGGAPGAASAARGAGTHATGVAVLSATAAVAGDAATGASSTRQGSGAVGAAPPRTIPDHVRRYLASAGITVLPPFTSPDMPTEQDDLDSLALALKDEECVKVPASFLEQLRRRPWRDEEARAPPQQLSVSSKPRRTSGGSAYATPTYKLARPRTDSDPPAVHDERSAERTPFASALVAEPSSARRLSSEERTAATPVSHGVFGLNWGELSARTADSGRPPTRAGRSHSQSAAGGGGAVSAAELAAAAAAAAVATASASAPVEEHLSADYADVAVQKVAGGGDAAAALHVPGSGTPQQHEQQQHYHTHRPDPDIRLPPMPSFQEFAMTYERILDERLNSPAEALRRRLDLASPMDSEESPLARADQTLRPPLPASRTPSSRPHSSGSEAAQASGVPASERVAQTLSNLWLEEEARHTKWLQDMRAIVKTAASMPAASDRQVETQRSAHVRSLMTLVQNLSSKGRVSSQQNSQVLKTLLDEAAARSAGEQQAEQQLKELMSVLDVKPAATRRSDTGSSGTTEDINVGELVASQSIEASLRHLDFSALARAEATSAPSSAERVERVEARAETRAERVPSAAPAARVRDRRP